MPDLTPANPYFDMPRYMSPADWQGGIVGNDVDVASTTLATASAAGAGLGGTAVYTPRTQAEKATAMGLEVIEDIGIDYGAYAGEMGRTGWIEPGAPYGPPPEPEVP